jgi:hypothetical protein
MVSNSAYLMCCPYYVLITVRNNGGTVTYRSMSSVIKDDILRSEYKRLKNENAERVYLNWILLRV